MRNGGLSESACDLCCAGLVQMGGWLNNLLEMIPEDRRAAAIEYLNEAVHEAEALGYHDEWVTAEEAMAASKEAGWKAP